MPYIALAMTKRLSILFASLVILSLVVVPVRADTARKAYEAMGIQPANVLRGTVLSTTVLPGSGAKQVVTVTTYFTGRQGNHDAISVRLDVFDRAGDELISIYGRDFGVESGDLVGKGELQLIDLDLDGVNEIIVSYESYEDRLIEQRLAEVIINEDGKFKTAWSGPLFYDATRAARSVPRERRDRFRREFDFGNTMRTRGVTLFLEKQMIAVAGERLPEPKIVQETFPLRRSKSP
jgi:hypothetical protein